MFYRTAPCLHVQVQIHDGTVDLKSRGQAGEAEGGDTEVTINTEVTRRTFCLLEDRVWRDRGDVSKKQGQSRVATEVTERNKGVL